MLGKRGTVMLFLRGLPEDLTRKELKSFVQAAVREPRGLGFSLKTAVCNCSIVRITEPASGHSEIHGLVEVQPATAAVRAIEQLNGQELKGARVEVRRYHHRSLLRDRRHEVEGIGAENRSGERRRKNLKIELLKA
jgi:hypothetical protein